MCGPQILEIEGFTTFRTQSECETNKRAKSDVFSKEKYNAKLNAKQNNNKKQHETNELLRNGCQ